MVEAQPTAEQLGGASAAVPLTGLAWAAARQRLVEAETYLLATVRPDARPHVVPVLAVWLDGILRRMPGLPVELHFFVFEPPALAIHLSLLVTTAVIAALYPMWLVARLPIATTLRNEVIS